MLSYLYRHIFYANYYRKIDEAIANNDWRRASHLAAHIGDRNLHQACSLARITQIMNPDAPQPGKGN